MRIIKSRINNLKSNLLTSLHDKPFIASAIIDLSKNKDKLTKLGFTKRLEIGETLLPPIIGATSRFNAEGKLVPDKTKPKDTIYWETEWTRNEWAGRGETRKVTDVVTHSREVWHKDFINPPSIELTISKKENDLIYITTPTIDASEVNAKHSVNLILELFGYCDILTENGIPVIKHTRMLNWQILPPGKRPWKEQRELLKPLFNQIKSKNKIPVFDKRLEDIHKLNPDNTSIGVNGYLGYVIFHFEDKNIHVLESVLYGNAIYIFNENWESLSQKTKAEILESAQHIERFTHHGERVDLIRKIKKLLEY